MASSFYSVLWLGRLSLLFSIIRVHPLEYRFGFGVKYSTKKVLYFVSGVFVVILVLLVCQLFWVCEPGNAVTRWKELEKANCILSKQVVIFQVVTDFLSDLILVFTPIRMIQTLSTRSLRRRLTWIFSTAIITTAVSIPHATFIIIEMRVEELISAYVEVCVGLVVCNFPVVFARLMRKWGDREVDVGRPKWMSISFASLSRARSTEDTENRPRIRAPDSTIRRVKDETYTIGVGWLKWDRDLPEDDCGSLHSRTTRPVTVDLGNLPNHEVASWSEHEYPPPPSWKKPAASWS
ncbi:hypothetical protein PM082_009618 [Marasmius tenuissimus]|nr:hypothetical protein PM082_009618 [Marasmius tenuissimus]